MLPTDQLQALIFILEGARQIPLMKGTVITYLKSEAYQL